MLSFLYSPLVVAVMPQWRHQTSAGRQFQMKGAAVRRASQCAFEQCNGVRLTTWADIRSLRYAGVALACILYINRATVCDYIPRYTSMAVKITVAVWMCTPFTHRGTFPQKFSAPSSGEIIDQIRKIRECKNGRDFVSPCPVWLPGTSHGWGKSVQC